MTPAETAAAVRDLCCLALFVLFICLLAVPS